MTILPIHQQTRFDDGRDAIRQESVESDAAASVMRGVMSGNAAALDELLAMYWNAVVAYACRLVGDQDNACDIAQETFLRAWDRRGEWQGGSVRYYLFRVARNLAVDERRRRDARTRAATSQGAERSAQRLPDRAVEQHELRAIVDAAVQALTPRRREAFTLVYLRGLSYRDASGIMDVSVKTLGNHLGAAVAELRERLGSML